MNFCIAGRCDGASSTSAASAGIADDSVCSRIFDRNRIGRAVGAPAALRPFGAARVVSGSSSSSIDSAGLMVAMMLVPTGETEAPSDRR